MNNIYLIKKQKSRNTSYLKIDLQITTHIYKKN